MTAGDFQKFISGYQVLNPDLVICNMDPKVSINMEIVIEKVVVMFLLKKTKIQCTFGKHCG